MDTAELSKRIENLLRIGTVAEVDHARSVCRVQTGKLLTAWLPWFEQRAGNTRTWNPPTVGEQVMVLSPSGEPAGGIVLRGIYQTTYPAPSQASSEHLVVYPDGARIAYNHETGALTATGIQTATVQAEQLVTLDCPDVHITGKLTVDDLLTYGNGLAGSGGTHGTSISGNISHSDGNLSSNDIVLHTHTHPGDSGGTTGGPQ